MVYAMILIPIMFHKYDTALRRESSSFVYVHVLMSPYTLDLACMHTTSLVLVSRHNYTHRVSHPSSLLGFLGGNEEPPERDDETKTGSHTERARRSDLVEDRTADETAQEEEEDGHDLVIARDDETTHVEQSRFGHEFAPGRGEDHCAGRVSQSWERGRAHVPVVVNWVLRRLPMMPCRPMLALMNPTATKERVLVHAGSPRLSATLAEPLCQRTMAPHMVKRVWIKVPRVIHKRVLHPILSPMRPRKAPKMKESTEQRAC